MSSYIRKKVKHIRKSVTISLVVNPTFARFPLPLDNRAHVLGIPQGAISGKSSQRVAVVMERAVTVSYDIFQIACQHCKVDAADQSSRAVTADQEIGAGARQLLKWPRPSGRIRFAWKIRIFR